MQIGKYRLEGGGVCPEQWWVYDGEIEVGYLRLRHGSFRAEHNGETVYRANPIGDGCFEDEEREAYLNAAVEAIDAARCPNDPHERTEGSHQRRVSLPLPLAKALVRLAENCEAPYWVWSRCKDCPDIPGAMEAANKLRELVEQANS